MFRIAADFVVAVHVVFVAFAILGGLLVVRWPRLAWIHVPAAVWGAAIEFAGWICPLTPLENYLRERGGLSIYRGDFIERYVLPLLYPAHLTRERQILLGAVAVAVNIIVYALVARRAARSRVRK